MCASVLAVVIHSSALSLLHMLTGMSDLPTVSVFYGGIRKPFSQQR